MRRPALAALALAALLPLSACSPGGPVTAPTPPASAPEPSASSTASSTGPATGPAAGQRWVPAPGTTWQWQLTGDLDLTVDAQVYDVDWQTPRAVVDRLHEQGRRVVCYVSVGTVEDFRDDAAAFPAGVVGEPLPDWPDERWLDVRRLDVLGPLLRARFDACRDAGFDAVEPDNVDAYANDSGFPLTADDQLRFNRWVAAEVRARGMSVGLKNDLDQVADLVGDFDFAVNESCRVYDECAALQPFVDAGKAVLHVEYVEDVSEEEFLAEPAAPGFSSVLKDGDLSAWRVLPRG
ncbi:endo alpha-1,4 polygalactosaminidase [Kineococcus terrestris]|uniref:endo alpha-1,4 polygalactosaminidase n=1 Tax=Kineococcus terrestris TaxID=2044856 RepID=UPI0034DABB2A